MFVYVKDRDFCLKNKDNKPCINVLDSTLKGKIICLDPGHGGKDRYNRGYSGEYIEADGVLDIAKRLEKLLLDAGSKVIMTRTEDITLSLKERCQIAERNKADIFLSIHSDAFHDTTVGGSTIIYSLKPLAKSRKLAKIISKEYTRFSGIPSRGLRFRWNSRGTDDYYGVLRGTSMPAIILECAFHTNPIEEKKLLDPDFRALAAHSIKLGILRYFKTI